MFIDILNEVESIKNAGAIYTTLLSTLTIPDIASSSEYSDGRSQGYRYIRWYNQWVKPNYNVGHYYTFDGADCWKFRCTMLHQGKAKFKGKNIDRIIFAQGFNNTISSNNGGTEETALILELGMFCQSIIDAARRWDTSPNVINSVNYQKNMKECVSIHWRGIFPHIVGCPVVG